MFKKLKSQNHITRSDEKANVWHIYEREKRRIIDEVQTFDEYEHRIAELCGRLKI